MTRNLFQIVSSLNLFEPTSHRMWVDWNKVWMRNNDMWQHFSTEIIKKGKISLIDLVACANIDTNDHFGIMAQETIKLYHSLLGFALQVFVKTLDKWKRFAQYTYSI